MDAFRQACRGPGTRPAGSTLGGAPGFSLLLAADFVTRGGVRQNPELARAVMGVGTVVLLATLTWIGAAGKEARVQAAIIGVLYALPTSVFMFLALRPD